ncbi:diacylglycerol/lipid kinase family protein [Massilia glaciei]|uniref:Diacylglycerol kinase n=1 Tax=Massilia glaciei TaxID=1524097 RepID=A0A2U2HHM6_9BURK|nr:diacylglycerol kinase family protein [Massilia glaciei]PWF45426.1 diacylglycerol kinase [Massilia glaciei]
MPSPLSGDQPPLFILLNAGSGHEETESRRAAIVDALKRAGRHFQLAVLDEPSRLDATAERMAAEAQGAGGVLVAAGGDGTINAIAQKAVAAGCMFGVLPQGTFNYFARAHGIPEGLGEAVEALLAGAVHRVQVGMVNRRIFLVNASLGLHPAMLEERERDTGQFGRSRLVALLSMLKTVLRSTRYLRISLEVDGRENVIRTPTLFIGNNALQIARLGLPLTGAIEDGRLAAVAPPPVGRLGMLWLMLRGALGQLRRADELRAFSFRELTVRQRGLARRGRIKVAIDGEVDMLATPLHFSVLPRHLLLLKPAPGPAPAQPAPPASG